MLSSLPKHVYAIRHDTGYAGFVARVATPTPKSYILTFLQKRDALNARPYFCVDHKIVKQKNGSVILYKNASHFLRPIHDLQIEQIDTTDAIAQTCVNNTRIMIVDSAHIMPKSIRMTSRLNVDILEVNENLIAQYLTARMEAEEDEMKKSYDSLDFENEDE